VEHYAGIVLEKSLLRSLIAAGTEMVSLGYDEGEEVETLLDRAERAVFAIGQRRRRQEPQSIREILWQSFEKIDRRYQHKGAVTGLATGFTDLDLMTSGLQPGDMIIVAARPSMGKTTWCTNAALHAALVEALPVAIFSLETSREQLVHRILCAEARVDTARLRTGLLADEDWRRLARAMGTLSEAPIFIDDSPTLSVMEMRAKARKLKAEHGLALVVVDYIQMLQSVGRAENRTQELSEIARGLKSLAKELNVPLVAISQLSRAVETLGSRRPMLSHLRESGELEAVADVVLFLYREDYYDAERAERESKRDACEVIVAKHRNGPVGTIELYSEKACGRFANLERRRRAEDV